MEFSSGSASLQPQQHRKASKSPWDLEVATEKLAADCFSAAADSMQHHVDSMQRTPTPAPHEQPSPPLPPSACSASSLASTQYLNSRNGSGNGSSPSPRSNF